MYGLSCVGALGVCVGEDAPPRWWPREREREGEGGEERVVDWQDGGGEAAGEIPAGGR